jgi:hypothetical protein
MSEKRNIEVGWSESAEVSTFKILAFNAETTHRKAFATAKASSPLFVKLSRVAMLPSF